MRTGSFSQKPPSDLFQQCEKGHNSIVYVPSHHPPHPGPQIREAKHGFGESRRSVITHSCHHLKLWDVGDVHNKVLTGQMEQRVV